MRSCWRGLPCSTASARPARRRRSRPAVPMSVCRRVRSAIPRSGHANLGAGRVVWMTFPKINGAIEDGSFAENRAIIAHIDALKRSGGTSHIMGLCSAGGVHAHQRHLAEVTKLISGAGVPVRPAPSSPTGVIPLRRSPVNASRSCAMTSALRMHR